jgi:hypothetical protein
MSDDVIAEECEDESRAPAPSSLPTTMRPANGEQSNKVVSSSF